VLNCDTAPAIQAGLVERRASWRWWFLVAIAVLTGLRILAGALLPLAFDESYYWLWSKHLAGGYFDHPPAIAWMIASGTALFGDTVLGVRAAALLGSVVATWMLWRAAAILLGGEKAGALAALLLNLTLMLTAECTVATPDAPALAAASALLYALAKLDVTADGRWWLAAGAAVGLALMSKYTGFFLGAGIVAWLVAHPRGRVWWRSPWLYAGAALTLLLCAPNLLWNAAHGWPTFRFQFGRIGEGALTLRYIGELPADQLAFASPAILILAIWGLAKRRAPSLACVRAQLWPALAYFFVHALHDRVQGNWPSFLYPALCVIAADMALHLPAANWIRRSAVPQAACMLAVIYAQLLFAILPLGVLPLGIRDPSLRLLGYGWRDTAQQIGQLQRATGAQAIAATDYGLAGWLAFYMNPDTTVVQLNDSWRWSDAPASKATSLLWVTRADGPLVPQQFARVVPQGAVTRNRDGVVIERYEIYLLDGPQSSMVGRIVRP
jgi:4-amino-4-deoxy-L-arabinose transferase-like glycosyltransferase